MSDLIEKATQLARWYHRDQTRKYTQEPYIVHPEAVATWVDKVPHSEEMIAASWLHDVVEDTECTIQQIETTFGLDVAALVEMLTDISTKEDGNRFIRKQIDLAHTAQASREAKTIKLADLIDNTKTIVEYDKNFARVYLDEKARLLNVLVEGDAFLYEIAWRSLIEGQKQLIQHELSKGKGE